jgi:hypothetical protein
MGTAGESRVLLLHCKSLSCVLMKIRFLPRSPISYACNKSIPALVRDSALIPEQHIFVRQTVTQMVEIGRRVQLTMGVAEAKFA